MPKDVDHLNNQQKRLDFFKIFLLSSIAIIEAGPLQAAVQSAYYIQVGAFKSQESAIKTLKKMKIQSHHSGRILQTKYQGDILYQVQVGPYSQLQTAKMATQNLNPIGYIRTYPTSAVSSKPLKKMSNARLVTKPQPPKKQISAQPHFVFPKNDFPLPDRYSPPRGSNSGMNGSRNLAAEVFGFPYHPRSITEGTLGEETSFFNGDLMMPLIGNNNWVGYVDGGAKYGQDEAWNASGGLGVRGVKGKFLWGAYAFMDYNVSSNDKLFWVANPGLEVMSNHWDAHLNGYFPVSTRRRSIEIFQGNQLGLETLHFINHDIYDAFFNVVDLTGPGLDGEIGYRFPNFHYVRAFVGGYHFSLTQGPTINGVEGGVEIPINNNFTVLLHDAYDQVQNNTAMATLRVSFGALPKNPLGQVQDRMLDPLQRHLGAYQTGSGVPIINVSQFIGAKSILNNVWFFNPGGPAFVPAAGFSNCTYENPCGILSQAAIDGINNLEQNAHFFFNTGTYNNPIPGGGYSLYFGQNFHGRSNYFRKQAMGADRPLINDSLSLNGNNALKNLQINANTTILGVGRTGVNINTGAAGRIDIENSLITSIVNGTAVDAVGINSQNNTTNLNLSSTDVTATISNSAANYARGIELNNVGLTNINDVNVTTNAFASNGAHGMDINSSFANISNGIFIVQSDENEVFGVSASNFSGLNFNNSLISVQAANSGGLNTQSSILVNNNSFINLQSASLSMNAVNYLTGSITGINQNLGFTNLNDSDVTVYASNNAGFVAGINNTGGQMNFTLSPVTTNVDNAGTLAGTAYGIYNTGVINLNRTNVNVRDLNSSMPISVTGIENSGQVSYQNRAVSATGFSPTTVLPVNGPGIFINLGNMICITQIDGGVSTTVPCP